MKAPDSLPLQAHWSPPVALSLEPGPIGCSCFAPFGQPCRVHPPKPKPVPASRILLPYAD